ncbi:MAG: DUF5916 domain-containing protein [Saprospiraceae bacterium]|nr:DUF5916 domain-containing protein [Saprospiraceae bacterium]
MKFIYATILVFGLVKTRGQDQPTLRIVRATNPIQLDAVLDDPDWLTAEMATNFTQFFPADTSFANAQSEVRMTYDDNFIYIGAKMYNLPGERGYVTPSLRRDYRGEANDGVTVVIDPFQDNTNAFQFGVNPFGVQREGLISNGGATSDDLSLNWDNKWYAEAKTYDGYWIAEMAIPFKTLRFKEGSAAWNINFYRIDSQKAERSTWTPVPRNFNIIALAFSRKLIWDAPLSKPGGNIALIPYTSGSYSHRLFDGDQRVDDKPKYKWGLGGDAKIGVGPALNLDLTFNPDFSQVEVDEQVTNLDRFEIFFPERRQFFLENADLFATFGADGIRPFFSRRIGVARDESTGQNIQNTLYAGARLSGKIGNDWRIGLLNIQAAEDESIGLPSINYTVAAAQRKVFSRSNIAAILVNKQPLFNDQNRFNGDLNNFNRVLGLDYNLASKDNRWNGKYFFHHSFENNQPDKSFATGFRLVYAVRKWDVSTIGRYVGANYNPETGFLRRTDIRQLAHTTYYNFYPNSKTINRHGPGFDFDVVADAERVIDYDINLLYRITFRSTAMFNLRLRREYVYLFDAFDPTRSGGLELPEGSDYTAHLVVASFSSDFRKRFFYDLDTRSGQYFNGTRVNFGGSVGYRFQPYGSIAVNFSYNDIKLPKPYNDATLYLVGPRFDFTFTRSIFWTTFVQYNSQIDNINLNSRFQWRFKPVSDLFIVYTDNYFPETFTAKSRSLVIKLTYWLNI